MMLPGPGPAAHFSTTMAGHGGAVSEARAALTGAHTLSPVAYKFQPEAYTSPEKAAEASAPSQGSTAHSETPTPELEEERQVFVPDAVDLQRLAKQKAEQEQKLKVLRARVDRLTAQERRVWKDVTWAQQMSLQTQEAQWRRQTQQANSARMERQAAARDREKHERIQQIRQRAMDAKATPRITKFDENQAAAQRQREDRKRLQAALQEAREKTLLGKQMQVECQRQQQKRQLLLRALEKARHEQARQDSNAQRYVELTEELQSVQEAIAVAECEELSAVSRLQNSQTVRAAAISELQTARSGNAEPADAEGACGSTDVGRAPSTPCKNKSGACTVSSAAKGSRSSPPLSGRSLPPSSPQQTVRHALLRQPELSPSPDPSSPPSPSWHQHKLGTSWSSTSLRAWSPGHTALGQITEEQQEEENSPARGDTLSPVELAVEEFRKQVASFQAQNQQFQDAALVTERLKPGCQVPVAVRKISPSAGGS